MSSLVMTLTETLRYRGAIGQWSWVLHRLTGLGVVLFLTLHVIDTSWATFYPTLYEKAIAIYQTPLFTLGEFGLVFAVVYHAFNGMRIAILDFRPDMWRLQQRAALIVFGLTAITLVPTYILMGSHVIEHYQHDPKVLGLDKVIEAQIPFAVGIAAAVVAAIILSAITGLFVKESASTAGRGSVIERFWWSYMRVSGLLIVPLVFGHLAMMHILQGVFDLTTAGSAIVGVSGAINDSGTAVEFVAERWGAGITIWKLYDVGLLLLVTVHGFNGLRYVLTDYTMGNPLLRRAAIYTCMIGGLVLLVVGTGALIGSIDTEAIRMACQARLDLGLSACPVVP